MYPFPESVSVCAEEIEKIASTRVVSKIAFFFDIRSSLCFRSRKRPPGLPFKAARRAARQRGGGFPVTQMSMVMDGIIN
jgi:hypothetical protein